MMLLFGISTSLPHDVTLINIYYGRNLVKRLSTLSLLSADLSLNMDIMGVLANREIPTFVIIFMNPSQIFQKKLEFQFYIFLRFSIAAYWPTVSGELESLCSNLCLSLDHRPLNCTCLLPILLPLLIL